MYKNKIKDRASLTILALIILSIVCFIFELFFLERKMVLDANSPFSISATDDRSNGGASIARFTVDGSKITLHCQIIASPYGWPYCGYGFNLKKLPGTDDTEGLDLSSFYEFVLYGKYVAPDHQSLGIRVQSRNFNPIYSKSNDYNSLKYNSVEYFLNQNDYPTHIPITSFQSPPWWQDTYKVPVQLLGSEFSNLHTIEVNTGTSVKPGHYKLEFEKIELIGRYIPSSDIYAFVAFMWVVGGFYILIFRGRNTSQALTASKKQSMQLKELNEMLNIKSEELAAKAIRDELTGVLNRSALKNVFDKHKMEDDISIIFCDIDYFKNINDTHGHLVGDNVLKQFCQLISHNTRNNDLLIRWGGEEFVIVYHHTHLEKAQQLAEKLREVIETNVWPSGITLTASFGVAQMIDESPTDFLERADNALYKAKANGRNCVISAPNMSR